MDLPKINIPKKYIRVGIWVLGVILVILTILGAIAYSKREALLQRIITSAIKKSESDYGLDVKIGKAGFSGFSTVQMNNISIVPNDRDTLTSISTLTIGVKLFPLLFGNVNIAELKLNEGKLNVVFKDSLSNLDFILKRKTKDNSPDKGKADLSRIAHDLMNRVLDKIPENMEIKNLSFIINDNDTAKLTLLTPLATIDGGELLSTILVNKNESTWHINGTVRPSRQKMDLIFFADNKKVELPFLERKTHAKLSFDTVRTELKNADYSGKNFKISGSWSIKNLLINHPKIAADNIIVKDAKIDADLLVGQNFVALDSSSTVYMKGAVIRPYIKYTLSPDKIYEVKLRADEQDAQTMVNAFPVGLFESLEGLQVKGKVKYALNFYLDSSLPDSLKFNSTLTPYNFKIIKLGKTDLRKINGPFIYTPYERGKPMRDIVIGPSNPNFTPLGEISNNFKNALLTAEDPSFFTHNGFVEESIRKSFIINFQKKKFVRGGSTISMQLVKNAFLSRNKTLARKAEEILIVWLIENNRLISKQRMLEVYFNIIEMGRNIYGIGEASRQYFAKSPSELNIGEGIFLANIVPNPKIAMFKFQGDGSLKDYMLPYFKYMGRIMARRGLTAADTTGYGFYSVRLREGLRQYLLPDSAKVDTTAFDSDADSPSVPLNMQDESKNLFDRLFGSSKKDKDSTGRNLGLQDTLQKSKKELRKERREKRRQEKEKEDQNK